MPPWSPPAARDFPNQVNNSVGFPGIFRGTLDVRAKTITDEMCIAAAVELAKVAEDKGLSADYIMPTMDDWEVFPREAAAVAMKAIEQGIALRTDITFEQEVEEATAIIARARGLVQDQMALGYIAMPEGSKAPAPTKAAMKAAARGAGDVASGWADKPASSPTRRPTRSGRPPQKAAEAAQQAADKAADAIKAPTDQEGLAGTSKGAGRGARAVAPPLRSEHQLAWTYAAIAKRREAA